MNMLATGSAWLAAQRKEFLTVEVAYARGENSVTIDATPGRSETGASPEGSEIRNRDMDWIITAADLVIDGQVTTPQSGDSITQTDGAKVYTFTVLPRDGDKEWRYCDSYRVSLRAHCKLTKVADAD